MDGKIKDDKPVDIETTISKHKLTLRDLAFIVGSSLASNPEIGEYEICCIELKESYEQSSYIAVTVVNN